MLDQITEMFAIGKFPCPGHRKHIAIAFLVIKRSVALAAKPASATTIIWRTQAGGTKSFSICRNRRF